MRVLSASTAAIQSIGVVRGLPHERGRRWPRRLSPALQGLLAFTIFTVFWVGHYVPALVTHPWLAQLDPSSMDPSFFIWSLHWWPYALGHHLDPMTTTTVGAPTGFNLSWLTVVPGLAVLAWPITAAFGPIVTFNLLSAIAPPAAGWAAFILCRRLTGRFWPALAGGAVYGFSAYEMNHSVAGHLNLTVSFLVPLLAYLVVLRRDYAISPRAFICLFAGALVLQMLIFLETFAGVTVLLAAALPLAWWLARPAARPQVTKLSRNLGVAYLAAVAIALPYLAYVLTHAPGGFARNVPRTNALNLASLLVPRPERSFDFGWVRQAAATLPSVSQAGYVGVPLLVIVGLLAAWNWRSPLTRFLVLMFGFAVLVAAGPDPMVGTWHAIPAPWALVWKLPLARSAFPVRFMVFGYLALAVMVARWLATPLRRPAVRWALGVLAVAVVIVNIPFISWSHPNPRTALPAFVATGEYRHYLARGEIVLVISARGNAGMLFQAMTNDYFRIAGGFVNQAVTPRTDLPVQIGDLVHAAPGSPYGTGPVTVSAVDEALTDLQQAGVRAALFEDAYREPNLLAAFRGLRLHSRDIGGVTIFQIPRRPAPAPVGLSAR